MITMPETVSPFRKVAPSGGSRADADRCDIAQEHRRPLMRHQNDVAEIAGRGRASGTDQRVLFRSMFDITAAEVRIVRLDARGDVM